MPLLAPRRTSARPARHRAAGRPALPLAASVVAAAIALLLTAPPESSHAADQDGDLFDELHGFTVLVEGDALTGYAATRLSGSIAAGGDLLVYRSWGVNAPTGSTPLPVVEGRATQLLTGGALTVQGQSESLQLDTGALRVGDTAGYVVTQDGATPGLGLYYHRAGAFDPRAKMAAQSTLAEVAAPGVFDARFSGSFDRLRAASDGIAALPVGDDVAEAGLVEPSPFNGLGQNEKGLELRADTTNLWRVSAAQLSGISRLKFTAAAPSASTPLIVDITDATDVTLPELVGDVSAYAAATVYHLGSTGALRVSGRDNGIAGALLAPRAALELASGALQGQVVARSLRIETPGQLQHVALAVPVPEPAAPGPVEPQPTPVAAQVSRTDVSCGPGSENRLAAADTPGLAYEWISGGDGTVRAFDLRGADLVPGTHYAFRAVADDGYEVTGTAEYDEVFEAEPTGCGGTPGPGDPDPDGPVIRDPDDDGTPDAGLDSDDDGTPGAPASGGTGVTDGTTGGGASHGAAPVSVPGQLTTDALADAAATATRDAARSAASGLAATGGRGEAGIIGAGAIAGGLLLVVGAAVGARRRETRARSR